MKILVINCGSSSIKYQLLDPDSEAVLVSGLVERIGEPMGELANKAYPGTDRQAVTRLEQPIPDHGLGMRLVVDLITDPEKGVIKHKSEIDAVGHRIVHGGDLFHAPVIVDDDVVSGIEACIPLAPLHNPGHVAGIRVARELFPDAPQVTVFDTAFYQTIPPHAFMYALPWELYDEHRVRRYGFHGTSHKFVSGELARVLARPLTELNIISLHLGNGGSATAIRKGRAIDTSMGLTPLEGLVMGTRSGDVDPAVHAFLGRNLSMSIEAIDTMLNKESGLKGLCGMNDMRDIHAAIGRGDERARIALDVQTYRIRKYIGAYTAALGCVDAILFTAGIGENDPVVRALSLAGLENQGVLLDPAANERRAKEPMRISADGSRVQVWVVPTNEELAIARETRDLLRK
ncbi:MAG: acetate kinase [Pseudodesulfovibrio sp.]